MRNTLIQKLFGRKKKSTIETILDADEAKPFFSLLGVNIETIGFPCMETRHLIPTMKYWATFENVKAISVKTEGIVKTIISGVYHTQAMASGQDSSGYWHPGGVISRQFRIEDGKLYLGQSYSRR